MVVWIDEAGRQDEALGVDDAVDGFGLEGTDIADRVVVDAYVGGAERGTGAVGDSSSDDDGVLSERSADEQGQGQQTHPSIIAVCQFGRLAELSIERACPTGHGNG